MTSTIVMTGRIGETSPRVKARIAGMFYLLTFLLVIGVNLSRWNKQAGAAVFMTN